MSSIRFSEVTTVAEAEDQVCDEIVARIYKDVPDDFYDVSGITSELFEDDGEVLWPNKPEVSDREFSELMDRFAWE